MVNCYSVKFLIAQTSKWKGMFRSVFLKRQVLKKCCSCSKENATLANGDDAVMEIMLQKEAER